MGTKLSSRQIKKRQNVSSKALAFESELDEVFIELYNKLDGLKDKHPGISEMLMVLNRDDFALYKIEPLIAIAEKYDGKAKNDDVYKLYKDLSSIRFTAAMFLVDMKKIVERLPAPENLHVLNDPYAVTNVVPSRLDEDAAGNLTVSPPNMTVSSNYVKPIPSDDSLLVSAHSEASSSRIASKQDSSELGVALNALKTKLETLSETTNSTGIKNEMLPVLKSQDLNSREKVEQLIAIAKERLGKDANAPKSFFGQASLLFRAAGRDRNIADFYRDLTKLDAAQPDTAKLNLIINRLEIPDEKAANDYRSCFLVRGIS